MEKVRYWEPAIELMDKSDLERLQLKRLKYMLNYVYERSKFYHDRFREAGLRPSDLRSLKDIQKFPFTTKEDLRREAYPYGGPFLCVPREKIICYHMSSGSTGIPTVGAYTYKDYETWMNIMARCYVTAGVGEGDIVMNIYGYGLFTGGLGFHGSAHLVGASVIPWSVGRTKAMIKALVDYKATVITGTPSYEYYVAELIKEMGIDPERDLALRVAIPGAEMWTEVMRKRIEEGLGLRARGGGARDIYGTTEAIGPGAGQECVFEQGFHFWVDNWYLEIIDPKTNEPVGPGEEGEIVITHLTREGLPLVRYRQGDLTVLDDEPCGCGRKAFPRCKRIRGRVDDAIHYRGVNIWPSAIQEALLKFPEVKEYQVELDKTRIPNELTIRIEVEKAVLEKRERNAHFMKALLDELRGAIFVTPRVELVEEGSLPRFEGKSKRVVIKEPKNESG